MAGLTMLIILVSVLLTQFVSSINFTYAPECLDIHCNSTMQFAECRLYVINYLQTYTGAGLYLEESQYNNNLIPIASEGK